MVLGARLNDEAADSRGKDREKGGGMERDWREKRKRAHTQAIKGKRLRFAVVLQTFMMSHLWPQTTLAGIS